MCRRHKTDFNLTAVCLKEIKFHKPLILQLTEILDQLKRFPARFLQGEKLSLITSRNYLIKNVWNRLKEEGFSIIIKVLILTLFMFPNKLENFVLKIPR